MTCESEDAPDWQGARAGLEMVLLCPAAITVRQSAMLFLRNHSSERGQ